MGDHLLIPGKTGVSVREERAEGLSATVKAEIRKQPLGCIKRR